MANSKDLTVWGIHGGKTGDADHVFLQDGQVALGWKTIGDLSSVKADREDFKSLVAEAYPDAKPMAVAVNGGQLFRFVHEMKQGDLIAYPSRIDKHVHIGVVTSDYSYSPQLSVAYPHQRKVNWKKSVPRTSFSQGALYEVGSAMSFFQVKNYADEYVAALHGAEVVVPIEDDETVALVASEIEQTTRDFVVKRLGQELKGHPFSHFVAQLLQAMGYRTRVSEPGPDAGIDIIAHKDELGFEPPIIKVQVKSSEGSVGAPEVQALYGTVSNEEYGLLVTLGTFTIAAKNFDRGKSNLRLIDGEELVTLTLQHYEHLDSKYKGLLPLKRVYIPEPTEESS